MLNRKKPLGRKPFKKKPRGNTGQFALFVRLWAKQKGRSFIAPHVELLPPEHPDFYKQGSHLLAKGTYPDYIVDERNVIMITVDEHDQWTNGQNTLREKLEWRDAFAMFDALKLEAHTKHRPT